MAYTVTELITRAYYLSGVSSRDLNQPAKNQITDGLQMLNALLSIKSANQRLIPYYKEYTFNAVAGQEKYGIDDLILPQTLTFTIGTFRYSMSPMSRRDYFGSSRANNIQSLPGPNWHFERRLGGADIYIYFIPNTTYPMVLWGKFALADVTLNQDLLLTLDQYYIEYLRYALAEYICQEYGLTFPPQAEAKLTEFEEIIFDISPLDMSISKISSLQRENGFSYVQANLGRGWEPF